MSNNYSARTSKLFKLLRELDLDYETTRTYVDRIADAVKSGKDAVLIPGAAEPLPRSQASELVRLIRAEEKHAAELAASRANAIELTAARNAQVVALSRKVTELKRQIRQVTGEPEPKRETLRDMIDGGDSEAEADLSVDDPKRRELLLSAWEHERTGELVTESSTDDGRGEKVIELSRRPGTKEMLDAWESEQPLKPDTRMSEARRTQLRLSH